MKTIFKYNLCLICFAAFFLCNAQSQYTFDKMLIYNCIQDQDSLQVDEFIYFINSKDNTIHAALQDLDSLKFNLYLRDNYRLTFLGDVNKEDFYKAEFIDLNCNGVQRWHNKDIKRYLRKTKINRVIDTILGNRKLRYYELTKNRKRLKENYSYRYYIIDESKSKTFPLITSPFIFEIFKTKNLAQTGVVVSYGTYSTNSRYDHNLVSVHDISKTFIVPKECDNQGPIFIIQDN